VIAPLLFTVRHCIFFSIAQSEKFFREFLSQKEKISLFDFHHCQAGFMKTKIFQKRHVYSSFFAFPNSRNR